MFLGCWGLVKASRSDFATVDTAPAVDLTLIGLEAIGIKHPLVTYDPVGTVEVSTPPGTVAVDTSRVQIGDALSSQFHEGLIAAASG